MRSACRWLMLTGMMLCCSAIAIPRANADAIDDVVRKEMEAKKTPGLALAILVDGKPVRMQGYGLANIEWNTPVSEQTIFQSGSVGKQFTATLVMMLIKEGKIGLDDPISKYLDASPEAWKDIKVRHLLSHTAGISNKLYQQIDMRKDYTEDDLVKKIAALPLDFPPGSKWSYSNPGYVLLGILIHKASGTFYGDLLQKRIFGPAGMATARIINEPDIIPHRASGYRLVKNEIKNQEYVSPTLNTTADGSLYLTLQDMARWDAALHGEKLLTRAELETMWTPVKLNDGTTRPYGFGWAVAKVNGHRLIEHGGAWQGFTTHIARYVDDKVTVIVLTNSAHAYPTSIAHRVAGLYDPRFRQKERVAISVDAKILDKYVGKYRLSGEMVVTVSREGDHLTLQVAGQPKLKLHAESPTQFFLKEVDAQISFEQDKKGTTTGLILLQDGERRAQKVE